MLNAGDRLGRKTEARIVLGVADDDHNPFAGPTQPRQPIANQCSANSLPLSLRENCNWRERRGGQRAAVCLDRNPAEENVPYDDAARFSDDG